MQKVLVTSVSQVGAPTKAVRAHQPNLTYLVCSDITSDVVTAIKKELTGYAFGPEVEVSPHNYLQVYDKTLPLLEGLVQRGTKVIVNATGGTVFMRLGLIYAAHNLGLIPESYNEALGPNVLVDMPPPPRR